MTVDIKGYEGLYTISTDGIVISAKRFGTKGGIVKKYVNDEGYFVVYLSKNNVLKTVKLHRIIAIAFIPNPNNLPIVCHEDENKLNNQLSNLKWGTHSYNTKNAFAFGSANQSGFKNNHGKVKDIETLNNIIDLYKNQNKSQKSIAKMYGFSQGTISNIVTGASYGIESGHAIDKLTLK